MGVFFNRKPKKDPFAYKDPNEENLENIQNADFNPKIKNTILRYFKDTQFIFPHFQMLASLQSDLSMGEVLKFNCVDLSKAYARKYLPKIGGGSSREVYRMDDGLVLKIGGVQNKGEVETYQRFKHLDIFPKVYKWSETYDWILSEEVMPIQQGDFLKILHVPYDEEDIPSMYNPERIDYTPLQQSRGEKLYHTYIRGDQSELETTDNIMKFRSKTNTEPNDEWDYEEYGDFSSNVPEWANVYDFIHTMQKYLGEFNGGYHGMRSKSRLYRDIDKNKFQYYLKLARTNSWFGQVLQYIRYCPQATDCDDSNFGVAIRDDKPYIVILDSGLTYKFSKHI